MPEAVPIELRYVAKRVVPAVLVVAGEVPDQSQTPEHASWSVCAQGLGQKREVGDPALFDFVNSTAPFALVGGANYVTGSAVVSPSLLLEEMELDRPQEELPKPPLVPPPPLAAVK